jgi:hypothetical protein
VCHSRLAIAALLLLCAGIDGCGRDPIEAARERAVQYFAVRVHSADPSWAAIFGYLHRRYGIEAVDANGRALHVPAEDERRPEMGAIYRRLWNADATVRIEQIAALASSIDRMSASALHCDRIPLPANWETVLRHASSVGGYALTHAVVAAQWTLDNGCRSAADLEGLQAAQVVFLERLAGTRDDLLASQEAGNDIWIEALAMLAYLGAEEKLRPGWLAALLASQNDDGGWSRGRRGAGSDPHPTALAIWVLSAQLQPDLPPVPWIAVRGPRAQDEARE